MATLPKKLLFIIGAGASVDLNLPSGKELKEKISSLLDYEINDYSDPFHTKLTRGERAILLALEKYFEREKKPITYYDIIDECKKISQALPLASSIDEFINIRRENTIVGLIGKLAIAWSILEAERGCSLYIDRTNRHSRINFNNLNKTWYNKLFHLITKGCNLEDLPERFSSIAFIIFNYDRCIEHFLYHALNQVYEVDNNEVKKLIERIEFYHPYGVVGNLPWQTIEFCAEFGLEPDPVNLLGYAEQIKTFTEGTNPKSSEIQNIRNLIASTPKMVSLGFAFHDLNLSLLQPKPDVVPRHRVVDFYSTSHGLSTSNIEKIKSQLEGLLRTQRKLFRFNNVKCSGLFDEYSKEISLG